MGTPNQGFSFSRTMSDGTVIRTVGQWTIEGQSTVNEKVKATFRFGNSGMRGEALASGTIVFEVPPAPKRPKKDPKKDEDEEPKDEERAEGRGRGSG